MLDMLRPHRHRIQCLKVTAPTSHSWDREQQNPIQPPEEPIEHFDHFLWSSMLNNLEYLELGFQTWEDRGHSQWPIATKLRDLRLYGPFPPSITFLISPSLKHLTIGDHPELSLKLVRDILLSTPALESLTLSNLSDPLIEPDDLASNHAIPISSLKAFSVIGSSSHEPNWWMLHMYRKPAGDWGTGIGAFTTPLPQIRKLDLVSWWGPPHLLENTLNRLPDLKELRIASSSLTNEHLKLLAVKILIPGDVERPIRCPKLTSLTIEWEPFIGSNIIRYIARSRNEASLPLRSVTLRAVDRKKVFWEDLQCIRDSGVVDLTVTVFDKDNTIDGEESEWSSVWSTDEESEDGLASGDEDVIAHS
ncbi:hypothetical protein FRC01_011091 [Tulasnella sp. 417]|nr:hypothetical protein FRC01_011091 [Tulasnella sp. 417]